MVASSCSTADVEEGVRAFLESARPYGATASRVRQFGSPSPELSKPGAYVTFD